MVKKRRGAQAPVLMGRDVFWGATGKEVGNELNTPPHPQTAPLLVKIYDTVQAEATASTAIGRTTHVFLLLRECCAYC